MNIQTLSRLHTPCLSCGIQYFSLSHLHKQRCRLCNQKIENESIDHIVFRNSLNKAIEIVFPRHHFEFDYGAVQLYHLRVHSLALSTVSNQYLDCYTRLRLQNRIRHGEWKSRRRKPRLKLLCKAMSTLLNSHMIQSILDYITWEETAVLYRCMIGQTKI